MFKPNNNYGNINNRKSFFDVKLKIYVQEKVNFFDR